MPSKVVRKTSVSKRSVLRNVSAKRARVLKTSQAGAPLLQTLLRPLPVVFMLILVVALVMGITVIVLPKAVPSVSLQATSSQTCVEGTTEPCACEGVRTCQGGRFGICQYDTSCTPGDIEPCFEAGCYTGRRMCNECGRWGSCVPVSSFVP